MRDSDGKFNQGRSRFDPWSPKNPQGQYLDSFIQCLASIGAVVRSPSTASGGGEGRGGGGGGRQNDGECGGGKGDSKEDKGSSS